MIPERWLRLWAVAVIVHILGNPRFGQLVGDTTMLGVGTAGLLVLGLGLLLRPSDRLLRVATNIGVVVVAWLEAPFVGNHWVFAALIAVTMLVAETRPDPWNWFLPTARWMFLAFYTWAAFSKLNTAFLDPSVSCGLGFTNKWLSGYGLTPIAPSSVMAWGPVVGTVAIELSIPAMLVFKRTRMWGVALGVAFHGLIAVGIEQPFFDFSATLVALLALFVPVWTHGNLDLKGIRFVFPFAVVAGVVGLAGLLSVTPLTVWIAMMGAFVVWLPFLAWFSLVTWRGLRADRQVGRERVPGTPRGVVAWLLVGVVVINGFMPYLEVKTGTSWNMYANLVTVNGESNHLVIRSTLPLTDHQRRLVTVLETDEPGLQAYVGSGYGIVERHFLDYLVDHPDALVRYEVDGVERTATGIEISEPLGLWTRKFQLFRSVDLESPARCQMVWLPAM